MADSQAQPGWLQALMSGLLGKIGLSGAAAQGGPTTPDPRAAQNPWVAPVSGMAGTANPPGTATQGDPQGDLAKIIQQQMQVNATQKATTDTTKPKGAGAPVSSLMDLFKSMAGNS